MAAPRAPHARGVARMAAARRVSRAAVVPALLMEDVHKAIAAGVPGCAARVRVLSGVSLRVATGEIVAVVGAPGTGKSLLLRCAAGLARCDEGRVRWNSSVAPHAGRGYARAADLAGPGVRARLERAPLVLIDDADSGAALSMVAGWRDAGAAVVVTGRDAARFAAAGARVLELCGGRLSALPMQAAPASRRLARVAEERSALR